MVIDESEGMLLATASANLMEQFDVRIDPKTQAIVGMIIAAGKVYGPRVLSIQMRKAQERRESAADETGAGTAGVYTGDGEPAGTTEFSRVN